MPKRMTTDEFVRKASDVHNNKYSYDTTIYKRAHDKVTVGCPDHGLFFQTAWNHLCGNGCSKCKRCYNYTTEEWIEKVNKIHKDKYNYTKAEYKKGSLKIIITCPIHGDFEQTGHDHMTGCGCRACGIDKKKIGLEDFIKRAKKIHNDQYDYSKVIYQNTETKILIKCLKHGEFLQTPDGHLNRGHGCQRCGGSSKGEIRIEEWLKNVQIKFKPEKTFAACKRKNHLRYDFYLTELNALIEYHGEQHYRPVNFGGKKHQGEEINKFKETKRNDNIKTNFALSSNIPLLIISHEEFGCLEKVLEDFVEKLSNE
jgi:hypothetical protein